MLKASFNLLLKGRGRIICNLKIDMTVSCFSTPLLSLARLVATFCCICCHNRHSLIFIVTTPTWGLVIFFNFLLLIIFHFVHILFLFIFLVLGLPHFFSFYWLLCWLQQLLLLRLTVNFDLNFLEFFRIFIVRHIIRITNTKKMPVSFHVKPWCLLHFSTLPFICLQFILNF